MFRSYMLLLVILCIELIGIAVLCCLVNLVFEYLGFWPAIYVGLVGVVTLTLIVGYLLTCAAIRD